MNTIKNGKAITVVSVRDLIWDIISQWKAVLIAALLMALLTAGAKYYKDISAYNARQEQDQIEQSAKWSPEEQIANILEALPEGDRADVEYMVSQQEWLDRQKDYVNNSLYAKANPVSQRTVLLDYYIDSEESSGSVLATLAYAFSSYADSEKLVEGIRDVIDPQADIQYVSEMTYAPVDDLQYDDGDFVLEVMIVVLEDTDADAIKNVVTDSYTEYSKELNKTVCPHTISLIRYDVLKLFNTSALNNRNSLTSNIYNIQNNIISNMEATLSDEQKAAYHSIIAIKKAAAQAEDAADQAADDEKAAESSEPAKPGIRKKYLMLGFILGAMIYAFIYALYIILKRTITSAGQTQYYTGSRLIGEVYCSGGHPGLGALFHSRLADKLRYRGRLDETKQTEKTAASLEAVCKHAETDNVTLMCLPGMKAITEKVLSSITDTVNDKGINTEIFSIGDEIDENRLITVKDYVIVSGNDSKATNLMELEGLCREYGIRNLGNIYLCEI